MCHYVMTVSTPRLCEHPAHRILRQPVSHILCRKLPVEKAQGEGFGFNWLLCAEFNRWPPPSYLSSMTCEEGYAHLSL